MKTIPDILSKIAADKNITLLYACETGSRAWGFPSPDSDYDIRFIYMQDRDAYLSISEKKDTIEIMDGDLDITGWDLRKCLQLLKKSNASLIERFQSPITYFEATGFHQSFWELITRYYSPIAVFYHHFSLAQKFREDLKDKQEIKLKSFFYLIRSLLSCYWITRNNSVLPMTIEGLMTTIEPDKQKALGELIALKATVGEKYVHPAIQSMTAWIDELFQLLEQSKNNLPVNSNDSTLLNDYFLNMVNHHANNR